MFKKITLHHIDKIELLLLLPLIFLVACSSDKNDATSNSVGSLFSSKPLQHNEVALAFIENLAKGKLKDAKSHSTEASASIIDSAAKKGKLGISPDAKYSIVSDTVAGKRALVQLIEDRENAETEWYDLVMVDDEWKVDLYASTKRNDKVRRSRKLKKQREGEQQFYDKLHGNSFKVPASYKQNE